MKGYSRLSIRAKIISLIVLLFVSLFAVFFYFFSNFIEGVERDLGAEIVRQQAEITKERALGYFSRDVTLVEAGLVNKAYQDWMRVPSNEDYKTRAFKDFDALCAVTDCLGWFIYSHPKSWGYTYSSVTKELLVDQLEEGKNPWYDELIARGKEYYTDVNRHAPTGIEYFFFDYFVREDGELLGVLGTFADVDATINAILDHSSEQVSNILLDNNGVVRAVAGKKQTEQHIALVKDIRGKPWSSLVDSVAHQDLLQLQSETSASSRAIIQSIQLNGGNYLAAYIYMEDLEWFAISLLDREVILNSIDRVPFVLTSVLILICLIVLTVYVLNTQMFIPIFSIHNVVKDIAKGQYDRRVKSVSDDELGVLADGINNMTEELSNNLNRIEKQNEALNKAVAEANKANQAKSFFLSNMTHELRTPMNAVLGFTQIGIKGKGEQEKNDYLIKIQQSGEHLLGIINDILDFNKIESNELTLEATSFKIDQVIQHVSNICYLKAEDKGVTLSFYVDKDIPSHLIGDPLRIKQILINLVSNAIKFTHHGGVAIHIKYQYLSNDNIELRISVTDTGIGMSASQLSKLFRAFTQADESITRKYGGTGLGLAISKQLVELMGGEIDVQSELDKGSTFNFSIYLKYSEQPLLEAEETSHYLVEEKFKDMPVLLVDDNQINQLVAETFLEPLELELDLADDGLAALEKAKVKNYRLIFMDIQMPNMNGYEATTEIRKFDKEVIIIGLSAGINSNEINKAKEMGMTDYITKPISQEDLFNVFAKYFS